MKFIPLTNSRFSTIVEDYDYERVMALNTKWCVHFNNISGNPDGIYSTRKINGKTILLHRFIMNCEDKSKDVDHKFHNIFDNRQEFLRVCSISENHANSKTYKNNKLGEKGIYYRARRLNYEVLIQKDKKQYSFGSYKTIEEAINARNLGIKKLHGEFANVYS